MYVTSLGAGQNKLQFLVVWVKYFKKYGKQFGINMVFNMVVIWDPTELRENFRAFASAAVNMVVMVVTLETPETSGDAP